MIKRGLLIVISGFSGAGKGTAVRRLLEKYPDYSLSISATTRKPREGEVNGREYFFKTKEEFEEMIAQGKLVEYASYVGNYYGTPWEYVDSQLSSGRNVILEIEIQGALKVKEKFPDTVLMFMMPPSASELYSRLAGRGTEDEATIMNRMRTASVEAQGIENYDYIVINDDLEKCVDDINGIIETVKSKPLANQEFIDRMRLELTEFVNNIERR